MLVVLETSQTLERMMKLNAKQSCNVTRFRSFPPNTNCFHVMALESDCLDIVLSIKVEK